MNLIKVKSMTSNQSGRPVANQFVIDTEEGRYFQSYDSIIAFIPWEVNDEDTKIVLDENYWDYSRTTGKYRMLF